jgi:hypothetical protein
VIHLQIIIDCYFVFVNRIVLSSVILIEWWCDLDDDKWQRKQTTNTRIIGICVFFSRFLSWGFSMHDTTYSVVLCLYASQNRRAWRKQNIRVMPRVRGTNKDDDDDDDCCCLLLKVISPHLPFLILPFFWRIADNKRTMNT